MTTINLQQLDDDVVLRIKKRASLNNRSPEDEMRHILESAAEDDSTAKQASFMAVSNLLRRATERRTPAPEGTETIAEA